MKKNVNEDSYMYNNCPRTGVYAYDGEEFYQPGKDFSDNYDEPLHTWGDHMIMNYNPDFHRPLKKSEQKMFNIRKKNITPRMDKIKQKWADDMEKRRDKPTAYESKKKKNMKTINESQLRNIISESIKKVLKEGMKGIDPFNVVPQDVAEKYGFEPEYRVGELELWGRSIDPKNASVLLYKLGIKKFTTYNVNGKVRITVKANDGGQETADRIEKELLRDARYHPAVMKWKYGLTPQEVKLLTLDYLWDEQRLQVRDIIKKAVKYRVQTTNNNVDDNWTKNNNWK